MGEAKQKRLLAASGQEAKASAVAGPWQLSDSNTQLELEAWFKHRGIDPSKPGLHDTPAFLVAEAQAPAAMNLVARLVEARSYSPDELKHAEHRILVAASAIANRVARDGRPGLCVTASSVLSRILDELHVWNYTAKSNLTIHFPHSVSARPRYFYSIDEGNFIAPHAIVVAPPFAVVDVTVKYQAYDNPAMSAYLPEVAASKDFRPYKVNPDELASPVARAQLRQLGMTVEAFMTRMRSSTVELMKQLPPREIELTGGRLGYAVMGVAGYQEQLRDLPSNAMIDGMLPMEIFEKDVLPKI